MMKWLLVGFGGFGGSVARYYLSLFVLRLLKPAWFPFGILTVNVVGCFLIGLLGYHSIVRHDVTPAWGLLLVVGFLGGFTTFSSFGFDTYYLFQQGYAWGAAINVVANVVLGLAAVVLGYYIASVWK